MTSAILGPEWRAGSDGRYHRAAARVILFDRAGRVLLMRGHDQADPARSWWFTVGGGIDDGEDARTAASREVFEETGLHVPAAKLVGPVLVRVAEFEFLGESVRQSEQFFLAHVGPDVALTRSGWTDVEQRFVDELRWWGTTDLEAAGVTVFPADLPALATELVTGWDGRVRDLGTGP